MDHADRIPVSDSDPWPTWLARATLGVALAILGTAVFRACDQSRDHDAAIVRLEQRAAATEKSADEIRGWLGRIESKLDRVIERGTVR